MSWTLLELAVLTGAVAVAALVGYRVGVRRTRRRRLRAVHIGASAGPSISVERL
jgi:hypothetical protein